MEKKKYFNVPTQVIWTDDEGTKHAGIAYRDEIICLCCGGVQEISEIYEYAPEGVENPIQILEWIDVSEEVGGDNLYQEEKDD